MDLFWSIILPKNTGKSILLHHYQGHPDFLYHYHPEFELVLTRGTVGKRIIGGSVMASLDPDQIVFHFAIRRAKSVSPAAKTPRRAYKVANPSRMQKFSPDTALYRSITLGSSNRFGNQRDSCPLVDFARHGRVVRPLSGYAHKETAGRPVRYSG